MIQTEGNRVYMSAGDYGVPIPISVRACRAAALDDLLESDKLVFSISRCGKVYVRRTRNWSDLQTDDGAWEVTITQAESEAMGQGRYAYRVYLLREGEVKNTVFGPDVFEVI